MSVSPYFVYYLFISGKLTNIVCPLWFGQERSFLQGNVGERLICFKIILKYMLRIVSKPIKVFSPARYVELRFNLSMTSGGRPPVYVCGLQKVARSTHNNISYSSFFNSNGNSCRTIILAE